MNTQKENNDALITNVNLLKDDVKNSPASIFSKDDVLNLLNKILFHPELYKNRVKNELIDLIDELKSALICDIENTEFCIDNETFEINSRNEISLTDYEVDRQMIIDNINSTIDNTFSNYINNL